MNAKKKTLIITSLLLVLVVGILLGFFIHSIFQSEPSILNRETTTCELIVSGGLSVYENKECTKTLKTIDWGFVETNKTYSSIVYVRNDAKGWLDDKDIVWQRSNVDPNFVYFSLKCDYGKKQIKAEEHRRTVITLTVLGLFELSGKLNTKAETPQFSFNLIIVGKDLSPFSYVYVRCYGLREANDITIFYKDDLKETISVFIQIIPYGAEPEVIWNTTKYISHFEEHWFEAEKETSYHLIVTINHERYGQFKFKQFFPGHL